MGKKIILSVLAVLSTFSIKNFAAPIVSAAQVQSLALQSNGQVVATGNATIAAAHQVVISRYNTDGSCDSTFGSNGNGLVTTSIGSQALGTAIAIQSDGSLVVAGYAMIDSITQFALARYTSAGALDGTFGSNGIVTQAIGGGSAAYACEIQGDGSILLAGAGIIDGTSEIIVMRFTSAGSLDTTFGTNGIVTTPIGIASSAQSIAIQTNGKIVVGGYARINSTWEAVLVRYNTDGSLDNNFGSNGIVSTVIGSESMIKDIVLDANGNIIAVGYSDSAIFIARYSSSGSLDSTFGTNGITLTSVGSLASANGVVLQSDGTIVIAGSSDTNFIVARYTTSGILDSSFGTNGVASIPNAQGVDIVIQADGNIVGAGFSDTDIVLMRYTTSGNLDTSWGTLGIVNDPAGTNTNIPIYISDQKSIGTNGGTFTAGAWRTRDLNSISSITTNISLSGNQIILQPGNYTVRISAPAYKVGLHQIRLQNITDEITLAYGSSAIANASGSITFSIVEANISVNKVTTLEVQHQCTVTEQFDGFGIAGGFGNEVYTTVNIAQL